MINGEKNLLILHPKHNIKTKSFLTDSVKKIEACDKIDIKPNIIIVIIHHQDFSEGHNCKLQQVNKTKPKPKPKPNLYSFLYYSHH